MRFLMLIWAERSAAGGEQADFDAWAAFDRRAKQAGVFVDNGALQPAATHARLVRPRIAEPDAHAAVEDRPWSPGPAQIEAFYMMECASLDEALRWADELPTYGQVEVRELLDLSQFTDGTEG